MKVNEIFGPTIQGEGKSLGMRTMFLRLSGCNLACSWCDTEYSWNWQKYDPQKEIKLWTCSDIISELNKHSEINKLVISGGEPMRQQAELVELIKLLKQDAYWVEIETNGTIEPTDEFLELIDQINCSPKTANSGNSVEAREKPAALKKYVQSDKTNFKFVVCGENDLPEIEDFIARYKITRDRVYLMPQARNRTEYYSLDGTKVSRDTRVQVMAHNAGFHFSSRLHILYWGGKRGF